MTETLTPVRPRSSRAQAPLLAVLLIAMAAALVPLARLVEDFPRADFMVQNDTDWDLTLVVQSGEDSVMPLMTLGAERSREITEVIVPGDTWRFIWRFAGDDVGTSVVPHDELEREGFKLVVPDEVADELRARGAPPSP
jgi:hypothetical protein